jgi:DNA-binding response OmpR family regulator
MEPMLSQSADGRRILIVDEERSVRQTLSLIFKTHGYQTRDADSAEEALTLLGTWTPHVAILDVGLPEMNGVELASLIRRQCPSCQILLFSGRPESGELVEEAGAQGETFEIAAKPIHPDFLLDWVGKHTKS